MDMKVIGVTGNIASGKSTVLRLLADLGAIVTDADEIVHDLMKPGTTVHRFIAHRFGDQVLTNGGEIDRVRLGQIVFSDAVALAWLEGLLHPAVYAAVVTWIARHEGQLQGRTSSTRVYAVDAVKMERDLMPRLDAFWVVYCPPEQQLARLMRDRRMSEEEAKQRLAAQPRWEDRLQQADVVIDNSGSLEETCRQVRKEWEKLLATADP